MIKIVKYISFVAKMLFDNDIKMYVKRLTSGYRSFYIRCTVWVTAMDVLNLNLMIYNDCTLKTILREDQVC